MSDSSNKRKYPRVEGKAVAAYLRLNGHNAGCTVHNISVGGIFVRTDRFLPVGTKLAFDLIKPGMKKAITVSGWVVGVITAELAARTKLPQGLRIQFAKLTPNANDALQELVGSLRRSPDAQPPLLYPIESKTSRRATGATGSKRSPRLPPSPALSGPPVLKPSRPMPSKALGDDPPSSTEVEMEARPSPRDQGKEDPSLVRKWFEQGEGGRRPGRDSDDQPMIDDSLLDAAGDPGPLGDADREQEEEPRQELEEEAYSDGLESGDEPEPAPDESGEPEDRDQAEEEDPASPGPNPFEDDDKTIGEEPTRAKARYGSASGGGAAGASSKRPTAPRPPPSRVRPAVEEEEEEEEAPVDELESANRELQRLLDRREGEIAALRSQVTKLEQALKDREEQLQLAKRVLRTNGLG